LIDVAGSVFDFRVSRVLGDVINNVPNAAGYDLNFCITRASNQVTTSHSTLNYSN